MYGANKSIINKFMLKAEIKSYKIIYYSGLQFHNH